jgi:serine acetyltransferase
MSPLAKAIKALNFLLNSTLLPFQAHVGQRVRVEHHGLGVVLHPNVIIGDDVQIWHNVTIASETSPGSEHMVRIGNGVMLGVGSTIIARKDSGLMVGDGARIGAGAVVTRDVPPAAVMVGSPARPHGQP